MNGRSVIPDELSVLGDHQRLRFGVRAACFATDVGAIVIAFMIGGLVRIGDPVHGQVANILAVMIPLYLAVIFNSHGYNLDRVVQGLAGAKSAVAAFLAALSVVGLVIFFLKVGDDLSRALFAVGAVASLALLPLGRFFIASASRKLIGDTPLNEVIIEDGLKAPAHPSALVIDAEQYGLVPKLDDPAMLDRLGRFLQRADRVLVACIPERRQLWATALRGADVDAEVFATELDDLGAIGLKRYHQTSTLVIAAGPLGFADRTFKRTLDLTLVAMSVPFVFPILCITAIAIKMDSSGPVLFSQERVGLGNRIFRMYKFRSMKVSASDDTGLISARRDDERVTRVGRYIRRTSIDELPQILNVLQGAMSIVGPRPHALGSTAENKLFWDIDTAYWHRHAVKPGMTGLAQVRGHRGATERTLDLSNRLHADLEYLSGWTIWRDLMILLATVRVVLHRNAF